MRAVRPVAAVCIWAQTALAFAAGAGSTAAGVSYAAGRTIRVSVPTVGRPVVEPHLSVDPQDSRRLLAAAMVVGDPQAPFETSRLHGFRSRDGGESWDEIGLPVFGYDPWTAFVPGGRALLVWLGGTDPVDASRPIRIFRARADGRFEAGAMETIPGEFDGAKMAVGGDPVLAATRFDHAGGGMRSEVAVYRPGRGEFSGGPLEPPAMLNDGPATRLCAQPVWTGANRLVVATMSRPAEGAPTEVWAHTSDDGGSTFTFRSVVSRKLSPGLGYAQLAAGGPGGDPAVVFVRALGPPHAPSGVWLNRSVDGGRSWSEELRVDRFPGGGGGSAQAPSAAFTPNGVLGVSWVDSGGDPEGRTRRLHFAWSTDGGRTFAAPIALAERGADPFTDENGATGRLLSAGGHYLGLAALPDGDFQALWSDSRDGLFALYTVRITPKRADSQPSGSPR